MARRWLVRIGAGVLAGGLTALVAHQPAAGFLVFAIVVAVGYWTDKRRGMSP